MSIYVDRGLPAWVQRNRLEELAQRANETAGERRAAAVIAEERGADEAATWFVGDALELEALAKAMLEEAEALDV